MKLLPSDLLLYITKLHEKDINTFNEVVTKITKQYTEKYNKKLITHIMQYYKTYKNPHRINAIRLLFTRLQEEAHPDTTDIIFVMKKLLKYRKIQNKINKTYKSSQN